MTSRALMPVLVLLPVVAAVAGCTSSSSFSSSTASASLAASPRRHSSAPTPKPTTTHRQPTLGLAWPPDSQGYGAVRPREVFNGGDSSGLVSNISWISWGAATATGLGTALYVGPTQTDAQGKEERATIVAFKLGVCDGHPAYTAITWYFPEHGQNFRPGTYINACTHAYVGY